MKTDLYTKGFWGQYTYLEVEVLVTVGLLKK